MPTTNEFVDSFSAAFSVSFDPNHLKLLRVRAVEHNLLPKSRGKSYAEITFKGAGLYLAALGMDQGTISATLSTARVAVQRDADGISFADALAQALADTDTPESFVHIQAVTVSKTSPYARIEYGRLDGPSRAREFGEMGNKPVEHQGTLSTALVQWAGSYFQNSGQSGVKISN